MGKKKCLKHEHMRYTYIKENAQPTMENTRHRGWKSEEKNVDTRK